MTMWRIGPSGTSGASPVPAGSRPTAAEGGRVRRRPGAPAVVGVTLGLAQAVLWVLRRDDAVPWSRQFGEMLGAQAVLYLAVSALLTMRSVRLSAWVGGRARQVRAHRGTGVVAVVFAAVHAAITTAGTSSTRLGQQVALLALLILTVGSLLAPSWAVRGPRARRTWARRPSTRRSGAHPSVRAWRLTYARALVLHRVAAVALPLGALHGVLDSTVLSRAPDLAVITCGWAVLGSGAVASQLLAQWRRWRGVAHWVCAMEPVGDGRTVINLRPDDVVESPGSPRHIVVRFAKDRRGPRPFPVVAQLPDGQLRIVVPGADEAGAGRAPVCLGDRAWVRATRAGDPSRPR